MQAILLIFPISWHSKPELNLLTRSTRHMYVCHERSGEALRHVGTATVVRDLEKIYSELEGEVEPIKFYGFSYGTVVGSYLVNM